MVANALKVASVFKVGEYFMTIEEIQHLIAGGETRTLELKKTTGELKDGMHSACAFLNTEGGWLIFGITPNSLKIIGQQVNDGTRQEIANALAGFEPSIDIRVEYIDVPDAKNGEQLIAMHFTGWVWGKHPYTYHGCPYYKPESTTRIMPQDMYDDRLRASFPHSYSWEVQEADAVNIGDLSEERVEEAVRLGVKAGRINATAIGASVDVLMGKFGLKTENGKLKNAAVVLFAKDTHRYPQLMIRLARFVGNDKNVFRDSQRVKGNFFDLLDAGMDFAFKHLNVGGKIVGLQREDKLEIPEEAMREGLINAFCHRSYDNPSGSVSMAIYDDRVEIENPGRLPNELTVETIKQPHDSYPPNLDIADVLYKTKYLDSWGSGVKRMVDACRADGVSEPEYELRPGGVALVFKRPSTNGNDTQNSADDTQNMPDDTQNDTQNVSNDTQKQKNRQRFIEECIADDNTVSTSVMAGLLGISVITVKRELKTLGYKWVGHAKSGFWIKED